jgi:hypothetical protein
MSEQNQQEPNRTGGSRSGVRRQRATDAPPALQRLDQAQESAHLADRARPARREGFPKDDRRSSELLTERERSERWPLG